jgi:voltage-gated potassium channel
VGSDPRDLLGEVRCVVINPWGYPLIGTQAREVAAMRLTSSGTLRRNSGTEDRMEEILERADPFMAWLGVIFALIVLFDIAVELNPAASRALEIFGLAIWGVFLIEFIANLWIAERVGTFLRRHWIQVLALLVPTLRLLRFFRLLALGRALPAARVVSSSYRVAGSSRALLRSRLAYLAATSTVVIILVAELAFIAESASPESMFDGFGDALLWSAAVVIALQADPTPSDTWARLVMLGGFGWGLIILGSVAGTVGSFLVDRRTEDT